MVALDVSLLCTHKNILCTCGVLYIYKHAPCGWDFTIYMSTSASATCWLCTIYTIYRYYYTFIYTTTSIQLRQEVLNKCFCDLMYDLCRWSVWHHCHCGHHDIIITMSLLASSSWDYHWHQLKLDSIHSKHIGVIVDTRA